MRTREPAARERFHDPSVVERARDLVQPEQADRFLAPRRDLERGSVNR